MKKLGFIGKFIFFINCIFGGMLLASYLLPLIPPHIFPPLSVLSLLLPILLILNAVFLIYWLLKGKRLFLLSAGVLLLGITHIFALFRVDTPANVTTKNEIKLFSYNVRQFNTHRWSNKRGIGKKIIQFIEKENPDIVGLQEYHPNYKLDKKVYPYSFKVMSKADRKFGQVIYSKYPIINKGALNFRRTANNVIYADIALPNDTIRFYNVHFQSLRLSPSVKALPRKNLKRLVGRLGAAFKKQEEQVRQFIKSENSSPYKVIVGGDFNNSATSYMYRKVKGDKIDAFVNAGSGVGATFWFDFIPLRIDFILADKALSITDFKTYSLSLSDHKPSMATFELID